MSYSGSALALFAAAYWVYVFARSIGLRKWVRRFPQPVRDNKHAKAPAAAPFVSIIVAARNEEQAIERTIRLLLAQRYPSYEVIAVNDRSEDRTGDILDALKLLAAGSVAYTPLHLKEVPQGWLGKNHALFRGYQLAKGQLILFTDADVAFHEDTIAAAVAAFTADEADHLTAAPRMTARTFLLRAFVRFFYFHFQYT